MHCQHEIQRKCVQHNSNFLLLKKKITHTHIQTQKHLKFRHIQLHAHVL
jgi:hypothetical protein